jgi:aryl-alcohol dehydrogenase-like predicted oxidoreductase
MDFGRYRLLGRTGVRVSPVCLGTDHFGGHISEKDSIRIIDRAIDGGINLLATADVYTSEPVIGKALKANGKRDQVLILTKAHNPIFGGGPNDRDNSRRHLIRMCERSLRRLQTDYIDFFVLHRCSFHIPVDETLGALTDLVRQGKVRYIGCSTHPAWKIMEALMVSELKGYARYVVEESPYNLLDRRIENELIPMCQEHGLGILCWSPRAAGALAGRFYSDEPGETREVQAAQGRELLPGFLGPDWLTARSVQFGNQFCRMAKEHGYDPAQLSLLWVKDQPGITAPLVGVDNLEQLEQILPVMEMDLDDEMRVACDELVPPGNAVANFFTHALWGAQQTNEPWEDGTPRV